MSSNSFPYNEQSGGGEATELGQEATSTISPSGAFGLFSSDLKKNEDLKQMLESNKDSAKLDAMKRIVGMIAKGKNASELFPAVVKNVASKNIEIKKLVYVYLVRYAEEQQDLALLSISTFQRALKDPNQLIRASALRVLSSIRVPIIVPIMMLAIKEASADLSPYVRKNAAHAIQKLYSLDPEQKEMLIEVIEKLLKDKSTLVAGSVVMAFEEVCPDRIDLIHKNYRKLCNLLVDVEEWGQVVIIHMLTRYARTQFVSPWKEGDELEDNGKNFYESDDDQKEKTDKKKKPYTMDPDHRLLIRNTKPLLQSRNAAVVMAVAQLYWHISPKSEAGIISKSLVRLLRSNREVQYIVLQNIATMSIQRKGMFEPYLKSFYVRSTDPTMIKTLKAKEWTPAGKAKQENSAKKFYSESEEEEDSSDSSSDSESESGSESGEQGESGEEGDSNEDSSEDSSSEQDSESGRESGLENKRTAKRNSKAKGKSDSEDGEKENEKSKTSDSSNDESSSIEDSSSDSESESEPESESESRRVTKEKEKKTKQDRTPLTKDVSLLDLDDFNPVSTPVALPTPALSPSLMADLEGLHLSTSSSVISVSTPAFVPTKTHVLLHRMSGKGLAAHYFFPRQPCIFGDKMVSIQITLNNTTDRKIENIHIGEKKLPIGMKMHVFNPIDSLEPEGSITVSMGIDFCDSTQTASFQLCTKDDCFNVNIQPPVGELLLPVAMSEKDFKKEQGVLTGMNETSAVIIAAPQNFTPSVIFQKVVNVANVGAVPSGQDNIHRFAAKTVHSGSLMLVTVELKEGSTAQLIINTEKTVIGSVLLRELKPVLSQG
uniref:Adaptor related protein complex 3 subunit beta 1 n=1 Tax=Homo sapiens TaxID=9606 RepID=A0A8Q3SHS6_HUMAN